jgi:hypothetical protein
MISSNTPGMFSFVQTAPADLAGSSWDSTVEGSQNFHDLDSSEYYAAETEDFVLPFGQNTPKTDLETVDDFQARWVSAVGAESKALKAEPMRRATSHGSTVSSHRNRSTKVSAQPVKKPRSMVRTLSSPTSAFAQERGMDVQQYISQDLDSLSVSPQVNTAFYPGFLGYPDGLPYSGEFGAAMSHVNPQIFDAGMIAASPHTWGSLSPVDSRLSSPGLQDGSDDIWSAAPSASSPGGSQNSSPSLPSQSPR